MKLFLVLIILLFEVPTDGAGLKKCFNNVTGYCRKKCKIGEIYESKCLNGKLCCVIEEENKTHLKAYKPKEPDNDAFDEKMDYLMLPTVTYFTVMP
ncbi:beta-defensin 128 [Microcebus murinus]|uniref:Beta-defensin n=1 Tax=Microcebus murinus TaxID=30608 RepID=A0A8B7WRV9_MICMU|nr:beta-defensin 128 [Microcebus murinus]